ncbi:MAG: RNA polymerase sigma factor [Acidobacteriota bacterium]
MTTPLPDDELLGRAVGYALSLCHDLPRAEELVQEACLAVLKAGGSWEHAYLFRAIRSRWVDQHRKNQRLRLVPLDDESEIGPTEELLSKTPAVDASEPALERALGQLPTEHRELLYLAAVEDYSESELARLTGRPKGTVSSLLHRARKELRRLLSPRKVLP